MAKIIQTMVHKTAYKNDVEFIAPDDVPVEKAEISESEEEEWVSGSDTEDESDYDQTGLIKQIKYKNMKI